MESRPRSATRDTIFKNRYLPLMKQLLPILVILLAMNNRTEAQQLKARLNHVAVLVVDVKTSANFYQHIIGLDTIPEPFHDGKHVWFSIGPKSHLHVIQGATEKQVHPKNHHLCFTVESVEKFT